MANACVNGIELVYETLGSRTDRPLLLVAGLGAQLVSWPPAFLSAFVEREFFVVVYDNRDVGLSTHHSGTPDMAALLTAILTGATIDAPYTIADLAADGLALLETIGVERAHVVGVSMGGMIAQQMAIDAPERLLSLTSIMSTTGEATVGQAHSEVINVAAQQAMAPPVGREGALDASVELSRTFASKRHFDAAYTRAQAALHYDRFYDPDGRNRQLQAIFASGSRADGLAQLSMPTLVIHGFDDALIDPSGGQRTAELVRDAVLLMIEDMGHDLPEPLWPRIVEAIMANANRIQG